jgi:hypothetical protein
VVHVNCSNNTASADQSWLGRHDDSKAMTLRL